MPFHEYQPEKPHHPRATPDSWGRTLLRWLAAPLRYAAFLACLPVLLLLNAFPWLAWWIGGSRSTRLAGAGWLAEWDTPRWLCRYCHARLRRLELDGVPFPVPLNWLGPGAPRSPAAAGFGFRPLATPVGVFMVANGRWRRGHWEPPAVVPRGDFTPADQQRGWYATEYVNSTPGAALRPIVGSPIFCKGGTPPDWCLLEDPRELRWVDPRRLVSGARV